MIVPVIDMMDSNCVSGKSGKRKTYTKLESVYGDNPLTIAKNLREDESQVLYIADLDNIEGNGNNSNLISKINKIIPVMLDNGISSIDDFENNKNICSYNILATETIESLDNVREIFIKSNSNNIVVSIDIKNNELLCKNNDITLDDIIQLINEFKPKYTIILNITQVGTKSRKEDKITDYIISKTPDTTHFIAGGITNEIIQDYHEKNITNFLIGTILHEGKLKYKL